MKALKTLFFGIVFLSAVSNAQSSDLTPMAQKLVFKAIADHVYLEANGLIRAPRRVSDFRYVMIASETAEVKGKSFSPLDNKEIEYHCEIELLGRGTIESTYDFEITFCDLKI